MSDEKAEYEKRKGQTKFERRVSDRDRVGYAVDFGVKSERRKKIEARRAKRKREAAMKKASR